MRNKLIAIVHIVCMYALFIPFSQTVYATVETAQTKSAVEIPAASPTLALPNVIPPDPAGQGYTLAPGEKKLKRKLLASGYSINLDSDLIWMDKHRIIINYNSDKKGVYDPRERDSRSQRKILVLNVDTGEVVDAPYEGHLSCYRDGRIAIYRVLFNEDKNAGRRGSELAIGKYGEPLQIPVPEGVPKDLTLNEQTCQLEPKDPVAEKKRRLQASFGGVRIDNEKVKPVNDPSVDLGRFDKNNPVFKNMNIASKEKWEWHGPDGIEKEIETNDGEIHFGMPVYLPFERGAYYFPILVGFSYVHSPIFLARFNRLIYPDGTVIRLPIPDLLWNEYVNSGGHISIWGSVYTKAGVIWSAGGGGSSLTRGLYLEDKARKQLIKLEHFSMRPTALFPDGCRILSPEKAANGGFADYYIINLCTGE